MNLRISTVSDEGIYQASKWLKLQVLCEVDELASLFAKIGPVHLYPLTGLVSLDQTQLTEEHFLAEYGCWIEKLKQGKLPTDAELRKILACALSKEPDTCWLQEVGKKYLVKIGKPVIQVQSHFFTYSKVDGVFRPMSMGMGSVFWGIQFSFPQVYQDPKTMELLEPKDSPNRELFHKIREWSREETRSTPFVVEGKKIQVPIRLGKKCFPWIHNHPQLVSIGSVYAD